MKVTGCQWSPAHKEKPYTSTPINAHTDKHFLMTACLTHFQSLPLFSHVHYKKHFTFSYDNTPSIILDLVDVKQIWQKHMVKSEMLEINKVHQQELG